MNEITELRQFRSAVPAEPVAAEQTMRVMAELGSGRAATPARPALRGRFRLTPLRLSLGLGALAATGTAVAVILSAVGGGTPGPQHTAAGQSSPRISLIAAAEKLEREPAGSGTYWRVRSKESQQYWAHGKGKEKYVIDQRATNDMWQPAANTGNPVSISQGLGTSPATPADREAWRRAGSPADWPIGNGMRVKASAGERAANFQPPGSGSGLSLGSRTLSLNELKQLPTDPGALKALILEQRTRDIGRGLAPKNGFSEVETIYMTVDSMTTLPVPPRVRAAAYRLLASTPELQVQGRVRDPLGRVGVAVALRGGLAVTGSSGEDSETSRIEQRLIIDTASGRLLARTYSTIGGSRQLVTYTAYESMGWTSERPQLPAKRTGCVSVATCKAREKAQKH
ncbi:CU044_5270 family protein [Actinomadura roseirufa]|uniref:CU044_5270 family protein n=1 Tax=Actinomadura roseirufa TaxID=2094049 RepID=UPI001040EB4B|nr:CU044_5270 family protein [Actinomadura roseirufa]